MHPGNIFVSEQGEIILVDFGIVGRLDMHSRRYIGDMLMAFLREDYNRAALVHLDAGYVPLDTDISAFEDALREIAVPIFNRPLAQISIAELLFSMFAVTERFKMETQPQLLLLQKTMVVIEGVARELADQVNIWMLARPLVTEWMARHMGPIGKTEALAGEIRGQLRDWMTLPQKLDRLMTTVTEGRIPSQHLESSRMPQILGSMLAAIGGGILASYATGEVGFWTGISGGSMIFFGLLLAAHR